MRRKGRFAAPRFIEQPDEMRLGSRRPMPLPDSRPTWPLLGRVTFRFVASYVVLYFFPIPTGLADPEAISGIFDPIWHRVVPWTALHVFHVAITSFSNGSGDTTYDYFRVLCMLALGALVTAAWSIVDRRRPSYRTLHGWGRIWLRYVLACVMLTYGISKLFHGQFYDPSYSVLTARVGDMSPQRLLWTVIGVSKGYEFFGGAGEVLGAFLLLFRRTALLGALIVIGVMSNVVALNMAYDVCVKLGSMHLVFVAVLLVVPDARRLFDFFIRDRPISKADRGVSFPKPWMDIALRCTQFTLVAAFVIYEVAPHLVHKDPFALFAVQSFAQDGQNLADDDPDRWKQLSFSTSRVMIARGGKRMYFAPNGDLSRGPASLVALDAELHPIAGSASLGEIRIVRQSDEQSTLEGTFNGRRIEATLAVQDRTKLRLLRTGFHWIHEAPDSEPR